MNIVSIKIPSNLEVSSQLTHRMMHAHFPAGSGTPRRLAHPAARIAVHLGPDRLDLRLGELMPQPIFCPQYMSTGAKCVLYTRRSVESDLLSIQSALHTKDYGSQGGTPRGSPAKKD